jgi:hypothetical protein
MVIAMMCICEKLNLYVPLKEHVSKKKYGTNTVCCSGLPQTNVVLVMELTKIGKYNGLVD